MGHFTIHVKIVKHFMVGDKVLSRENIRSATLALEGLSVGDAFGQCFFGTPAEVWERVEQRQIPQGPWPWTDDTAMARVVLASLEREERIEPRTFSRRLASEYRREPGRGYGRGAAEVLQEVGQGVSWSVAAGRLFRGTGSKGNGAAMRTAPVGAYFAESLEELVEQATDCSRVTHAHPEGIAGGVAVALAAAWHCGAGSNLSLLDFVLEHTPPGQVRRNVRKAQEVPANESVLRAAEILGNGSNILAEDTVPFCLWCATHHGHDFEHAMWTTVSALGDRDTTCAIVGGIIACRSAPPTEWSVRREPLYLERL